MNTKHTRVVVALLLAVASLATVGFRAPHEDSLMASILPDHATCAVIEPSLTAIELLEFVDDHCFPGLVDQVESEIDNTFSGTGPSAALLDWFYAPSRFTVGGSVEYLEIVEMELDEGFSSASSTETLLNSSLERSRVTNVSSISPADLTAIVQQKGYVHPSDIESLLASRNRLYRSTGFSVRSRSTGLDEYFDLLESESDAFGSPSAGLTARSRSPGPEEYFDLLESESDAFAGQPVGFTARSRATNVSSISPADLAAIVQYKGYVHPSDIESLLANGG